jgi:hypothetical protein
LDHLFFLFLLIFWLWFCCKPRRGRRSVVAAHPLVAGVGLAIAAVGVFLVTLLLIVLHLTWEPAPPQASMRAVPRDAQSAVPPWKLETKSWTKHLIRNGKRKSSSMFVVQTEKMPPAVAMPDVPTEMKRELVAKNGTATKLLQRQPPSPPAAVPDAGQRSRETAAKPQAAAAKARPAWVDAPPQVVDGVYQTSITVGPYTTRDECDAKMPEALQEALDHYVDVGLEEEIAGQIRLPNDYVRQQLVKDQWQEVRQYSVGPMIQLHVLLGFDRQVKERILEGYRQTLVAERLWWTGGVLGAILTLLALLYGYLKWSSGSLESSTCLPPKSMPC